VVVSEPFFSNLLKTGTDLKDCSQGGSSGRFLPKLSFMNPLKL